MGANRSDWVKTRKHNKRNKGKDKTAKKSKRQNRCNNK